MGPVVTVLPEVAHNALPGFVQVSVLCQPDFLLLQAVVKAFGVAVALREMIGGAAMGEVQFGQAEFLRRSGEAERSLVLYRKGIALAEALQNPEIIWQLYHGQGRALKALNKNDEAIAAYRAAVECPLDATAYRLLWN